MTPGLANNLLIFDKVIIYRRHPIFLYMKQAHPPPGITFDHLIQTFCHFPMKKFGSQVAISGKTNMITKATTRAVRKGTTPL